VPEVLAAVAVSRASQQHVHGDAAPGGFDTLRVLKPVRRCTAEVWAEGAYVLRVKQLLQLQAQLGLGDGRDASALRSGRRTRWTGTRWAPSTRTTRA
jgi:hypothetical protein